MGAPAGGKAASTIISNRKTSTISDPKSKGAKQTSDTGKAAAMASGETGSQVRSNQYTCRVLLRFAFGFFSDKNSEYFI